MIGGVADEPVELDDARHQFFQQLLRLQLGLGSASACPICASRLVGQEVSGGPQDANAARAAYRSLREHLRDLGVEGEVADELAQLLDRHLDTLDGALAGTGAEGLGPAAGRLVALRDLLRRTVTIGGRPVSDGTPGV